MAPKAIDSRIPTLIRNGVATNHRSFFVIVGDHGRDQIVNLHFLLTKVQIGKRPNVLWMYKKDLIGFTSHRKKREKQLKKAAKRGTRDPNEQDPFEAFISLTDIRYCYYKESEKILGQTFGMLVLQDFEAITPNLLARSIETVAGGGIVVILLKTMASLKQMYTMTMDVHARYRTAANQDIVARFNERFLLSLSACPACLVIDDEMNVLQVSGACAIKPIDPQELEKSKLEAQEELESTISELEGVEPVHSLVKQSRTLDQSKVIISICQILAEKTLRSTISLTAARGRGKSAALGISTAAAIAMGYSNIFVTSPTPENLKTFFEFVLKGFDALGLDEHSHYDIVQSTDPQLKNCIVRLNVHKQHRQTIQYINPTDNFALGQAELVIIDEAAAIPLPVVQKLLGPYLVFMASTIQGYEGTGRSLSLKLLERLRGKDGGVVNNGALASGFSNSSGRSLSEFQLEEPIRYSSNDAVEKWLNKLLCLNATMYKPKAFSSGMPHPDACTLFYVNRDTLFSFHPVAEAFLSKLMGLFVASHYKNSPNDLQLLSDAPAHQIFVLLPTNHEGDKIPDPLCAIQIAFEGHLTKESIRASLHRGQRASGDMIPWLMSQQYQDDGFGNLSGARIVRMATNTEAQGMGFGTRALELLTDYFLGKFTSLSENFNEKESGFAQISQVNGDNNVLKSEVIKVRDASSLPPLFNELTEVQPARLDYLGVSFGLTQKLLKFWKRGKFVPLYLRHTTNDLTGEHSAVMIKTLSQSIPEWLHDFSRDFYRRFVTLLNYHFAPFPTVLALSFMEAIKQGFKDNELETENLHNHAKEVLAQFSVYDLKRLESYSGNMLDHHVILDLMPQFAHQYFDGNDKLGLSLSSVQQAILLGLGLQHKGLEDIEGELKLSVSQTLAILTKILRKFNSSLVALQKGEVMQEIEEEKASNAAAAAADTKTETPSVDQFVFEPVEGTLAEEEEEAASEARRALNDKQRDLLNAIDWNKYAINDEGDPSKWKSAEQQVAKGGSRSVSVLSDKTAADKKPFVDRAPQSKQNTKGKKRKERH